MNRNRIATAIAVPVLAMSGMVAAAPAANAAPLNGPTVAQTWINKKICNWTYIAVYCPRP